MNTTEIIDEIKCLDESGVAEVVSELKGLLLDSMMDNDIEFVCNEITNSKMLISIINDNIKMVCDSIPPEDYIDNYGDSEEYLTEIFNEVISKQIYYYYNK